MVSISKSNGSQTESFKVDSIMIDKLLQWISIIIRLSFEKVDKDQRLFLDLIQLFIDLLKDDSIL